MAFRFFGRRDTGRGRQHPDGGPRRAWTTSDHGLIQGAGVRYATDEDYTPQYIPQGPQPAGAGGYGPRGPRWPGDVVPAWGTGYMNDGLVIGIDGPPIVTGGNPWPQMTMVGLNATIHRVYNGQTMQMVANQYHGPGADASALAGANPHLAGLDIHEPIAPGTRLAIPPAPDRAPQTPGGPGGSGVGGGSVTAIRATTRGGNAGAPAGHVSAVNTRAKGPH